SCAIGIRPEWQQALGNGVGDSGPFVRGGNTSGTDGGRDLPEALIGKEEEGPVFSNRPARGGAELIAVQNVLLAALLVGEEVGGVHFRFAKILEGRAVKLVAAALGHDVDLAAGAAAKLGE